MSVQRRMRLWALLYVVLLVVNLGNLVYRLTPGHFDPLIVGLLTFSAVCWAGLLVLTLRRPRG